MFKKIAFALPVLAAVILVAGCQTAGDEYRADSFQAGQVNSQQAARTVKIITVSPARVEVTNESNKKAATMIGGLLGAVGGGVLGNTRNRDTAIVGAVGGGVAGAMAGSMVNDKALVPGVLISYSENGRVFTSVQVGKLCEFAVGEISLIVTSMRNETRIQPNAVCPVAKS